MVHARREEGPRFSDEYTVDGALGNTVQLVQPRAGYRFAVDSVLLARFAAQWRARHVLDLGCGCGVVGLCVLALRGEGCLFGVDLQADLLSCARESAARNRLQGSTTFQMADFRELRATVEKGAFDLVVSNPPYRTAGQGRLNNDLSVATARAELNGTVHDLAAAASFALADKGRLCVVYPASRLGGLLTACHEARLRPRELRLVHPRVDGKASMALLCCVKGGRGDALEVHAPLILHGGTEKYSAEAAALLGPP